MIKTAAIPYFHDEVELEGYAAYPSEGKRPTIILCHAWQGRNEFICKKAESMAAKGYTGFALDLYGKGVVGRSKEENAALKAPFLKERGFLQERLLKALEAVSSLPYVDPHQIAVLGFGFGGLCALDFARSGAQLKGAISVYGHFEPSGLPKKPIHAKILVLQGFADPIVTPEELLAFGKEMRAAHADWQAHLYGEAMHAFATPGSNDSASGILYHPLSAQRAEQAIDSFLKEIFTR